MDPADTLRSPDRLAALHSTALLDTPTEEVFDRLTRLISRSLHVPVSLITLVDAERQWFKSAVGLPEPLASTRETPLSHSICQHVAASGKPLVIPDARTHPLVRTNPVVTQFGVMAYAGVPLVTAEGHALGAFCAIARQPRWWTAEELEILQDLAAAVMAQIELRRRARELPSPEQITSPAVAGETILGAGAALPPVTPQSPVRDEPLPASRTGDTAQTPSVETVSGELRNELRNALNGIIGFSEVLADEIFGPLNSRQARYVQNILTSGRHLLQLLDDDPEAAIAE